jgi:exopolyphosphatase/guanosine-5'-triphosphate,3'-diphosphate pyrophosphatase
MRLTASTTKKALKKVELRIQRRGKRFAILDLGTNSIRFDIYELQPKRLTRILREKRMVRLGDGVFETGRLTDAAKKRTLKVLREFSRLIKGHGVSSVTAVGTSALRSASNAKAFIAQVYKDTGIMIQVISGKEESALIARGILSHVRMPNELTALIDIGGGSTEFTFCKGNRILKQLSLALGANRLNQVFLKESPPRMRGKNLSPDLALRQHLRLELKNLQVWLKGKKCASVIGSSGTIRNLGKVLKRMGYKAQPFKRRDLSALVAEMRILSSKDLQSLPGIEPKRVDLILAGSILFEESLYALGAEKFFVTDLALRDGLLLEELEKWL